MSSYVINVGRERPSEVLIGYVNKDGSPKGDPLPSFVSVGKHMIMNTCSVWGRRLIDGKPNVKEGKESPVEFNTPGYSGEIEFLKWGDPNGYALTIRYLNRSRSLDVEYQDNIQKIKIDVEKGEDGSAQIFLDAGENKFDLKKDSLYIKYLQVHAQNRDSVSKNPDPVIKGYAFYEVTEDGINKSSIKRAEDSFDAGGIVRKYAESPESLKAILAILGKRPELEGIDNLSKGTQIYAALLNFTLLNPADFLSLVGDWKKQLSNAFEKAKAFKALDLTKDGFIALIVDEKPNIVWSGLKGKGEAMIDNVVSNYLDSENYKSTVAFIELVEKIK